MTIKPKSTKEITMEQIFMITIRKTDDGIKVFAECNKGIVFVPFEVNLESQENVRIAVEALKSKFNIIGDFKIRHFSDLRYIAIQQ